MSLRALRIRVDDFTLVYQWMDNLRTIGFLYSLRNVCLCLCYLRSYMTMLLLLQARDTFCSVERFRLGYHFSRILGGG